MNFSVFLNFDAAVFQWVENHLINPAIGGFLYPVLLFLTKLGDDGILWIVLSILLMIFKKTRKAGFTMAGALVIMMVCNNLILKNVFARPRPYNLDWPTMKNGWTYDKNIYPLVDRLKSYSFPSGHASSAFAAATGLTASKKAYFIIPGFLLAATIAFSRIYVHIHYPTDVFFGALFGIVYGLIAVFVCKFIIKLINDKTKLNLFREKA